MVELFIHICAVDSIIITFEGVIAKGMGAGSKWPLIWPTNLGQFTIPLNIGQRAIKNCIPKYPTDEGCQVEKLEQWAKKKPLQVPLLF